MKLFSVILYSGAMLSSTSVLALDESSSEFSTEPSDTQTNDSRAIASTTFDSSLDDVSESSSDPALQIGSGMVKMAAVYFVEQSGTDLDAAAEELTGVGASYYFKPEGPTFYFQGGFGIRSISFEEGSRLDDGNGSASMLGFGYEAAQGFNIELNFMNIQAEESARLIDASTEPQKYNSKIIFGYQWF